MLYADTLLDLERAHLLRVLVWGAGSVLAGTLLLLLVVLRRAAGPAPLLKHFALQTAAWGAIDLALALWGTRGLALRDHAGAVRLDRLLWLNLGLDVGYVGVGVALAAAGWSLGRRLGLVGAGSGVVVQGAALFLLDLVVVRQLLGAV